MSEITVTKNKDASRWEATDGTQVVGVAEYIERGDSIAFTHTVVPPEFGGQGIAGKLARASLDDARERGLVVIPQCSYYAEWIQKHPDYADLTR